MPVRPDDLYGSPNALAGHYAHFRVAERLLLTGHSHQAWPDVGLAAQQEAWEDAARLVDDKWGPAFERADRVRAGWRQLLDDSEGDITLGANTHELVIRLLSALPLRARPRIVTTDGEFHTLRRQLDRLAEEGLEIDKVPATPAVTLAERVIDRVDDRVAAVMISAVLFRNAHIVPGLGAVQTACARHGATLLVDAYHALNAIPFSLVEHGLEAAFVVGGGYKYCQLGEGNCFLRVPPECDMRPIVTGWFSEFSALEHAHGGGPVAYGTGPDRFAGATYDPTSHYRASAIFDFFDEHRLTPTLLREVSQHQIGVLVEAFDRLDVPADVITRDRSVPLDGLAGFLALDTSAAGAISAALRARDVFTDHRGSVLRFGPAPYLTDQQLRDAIGHLAEVVATVRPAPS